jgi:integrase-like protein
MLQPELHAAILVPAPDMTTLRPKLLTRMRGMMRVRHLGPRTEQPYLAWVRRFARYHGLRHPADMREPEVIAYLTHLAVERRVSRSTQMQALSALLFLYREVFRLPLWTLLEAR